MALTKTVTSPQGFEATSAYHRVDNVSLHGKNKISFSVNTSKDANSQMFNTTQHLCDYSLNGDNPIKQAYLYLKTLNEYSGSEDI